MRGVAYSQELKALASQALPFSTDEDGVDSSGMNPLASVFDLGKEPMDFWEDRVRGWNTLFRPSLVYSWCFFGGQNQLLSYPVDQCETCLCQRAMNVRKANRAARCTSSCGRNVNVSV